VTGEILDVKGRQTYSLGLVGRNYNRKFLVFPVPTEAAGLLGTDFLEGRSAHTNFEDGKMLFKNTVKDNRAQGDTFGERRFLTVLTPGKEGHSPQPKRQTEKTKDERFLESTKLEKPTSQIRTWLVKALENVVLAPRCKQVTVA